MSEDNNDPTEAEREQFDRDCDQNLAQRVFAALMSYRMGVTLPYFYNREAKDKVMNSFWVSLSRSAIAAMDEARDRTLGLDRFAEHIGTPDPKKPSS